MLNMVTRWSWFLVHGSKNTSCRHPSRAAPFRWGWMPFPGVTRARPPRRPPRSPPRRALLDQTSLCFPSHRVLHRSSLTLPFLRFEFNSQGRLLGFWCLAFVSTDYIAEEGHIVSVLLWVLLIGIWGNHIKWGVLIIRCQYFINGETHELNLL